MQDSVHTSQQTGDPNILQHCGKGLPQVRNKPDIWLLLATQTEPSWNWPGSATRMPMSESYNNLSWNVASGKNFVKYYLLKSYAALSICKPNLKSDYWNIYTSMIRRCRVKAWGTKCMLRVYGVQIKGACTGARQNIWSLDLLYSRLK